MTYLPSLLKKIDEYCYLSESLKKIAQSSFSMPDDPEEDQVSQPGVDTGLYSQIVNTANEFSNQDVAEEILLIAELYKKALEINGGYTQVNRALSTALSNMDSLIDEGTVGENELDTAENILNEVSKDLRQRAKASPNQLSEAQAGQILKETRQNFNQKAIREEIEQQPKTYEMYQGGDKDNPSQSGHSAPGVAELKTPQNYLEEIERYTDQLNDPTYDQKIKDNIKEIIKIVQQLSTQLTTVISLQDQLKLTPNDSQLEQQLDTALEIQQKLQDQRRIIRAKLNSNIQDKKKKELEQQVSGERDPLKKQWLEEKLKLQELRSSPDYNKGEQIRYQKMLVNSLGTMDGDQFRAQKLSPETERKIRADIEAGKAKVISKYDYDRRQSKERAEMRGTRGDPKIRGQRGGGVKGEIQNHGNFQSDVTTYSGLVVTLGEKINTAFHVARLNVTGKKKELHEKLKQDVDAYSLAIRKKDIAGRYKAIQNLKRNIDAMPEKMPAIKTLETSAKLYPYFKKHEAQLKKISELNKLNNSTGRWNITPEQRAYIHSVINNINERKQIYLDYSKKISGLPFTPVISHLEKTLEKLELELNQAEQTVQANYNTYQVYTITTKHNQPQRCVMSKRIQLLNKLIEADQLLKLAQSLGNEEVDPATADQMAEQVFDKLFDDMVNNLTMDKLVKP